MKIAIHHRKGSFSDRWIKYCKKESIPHKIVNVFDNDIVAQLKDCDSLMWHHHHEKYKNAIAAKSILFALEHAGINVFPDFNTAWHFNDKVGQKYLLEAIDAPLVTSYVFYDQAKALSWASNVYFPKVFKLRGGAGSENVQLVSSEYEATKLIRKAFNSGFRLYDRWNYLKELKYGSQSFPNYCIDLLRGIKRGLFPTRNKTVFPKERGYVYFQDYIPDNHSDIRVIVIGEKAFAVKRIARDDDFRASGSGMVEYDKDLIDERCVDIAFKLNEHINATSIAYDFVFDKKSDPLLVEISYGFSVESYDPCPGYWDINLNWYEGKFIPQEWMVEEMLMEVKKDK